MESILALLGSVPELIEKGQSYVLLLPVYTTLLFSDRIGHFIKKRRWDDRDAAANLVIPGAYMVRDFLIACAISGCRRVGGMTVKGRRPKTCRTLLFDMSYEPVREQKV